MKHLLLGFLFLLQKWKETIKLQSWFFFFFFACSFGPLKLDHQFMLFLVCEKMSAYSVFLDDLEETQVLEMDI